MRTIRGSRAALTDMVAGFSGRYSWPGVNLGGDRGLQTMQRSFQGERVGYMLLYTIFNSRRKKNLPGMDELSYKIMNC